ncbi:MAG: hypothetical protein AB1468_06420, partial [Candidatus Micrarchaeota archaeon]
MKAALLAVLFAFATNANALLISDTEVYPNNRSIIWYVGEERILYFNFWNDSQVFEMDECRSGLGMAALNLTFHSVPVTAPDGKQYY